MRSEPRATPVARGMGLDEQRNRQTNRKTIEHMQSTDTQIFKTTVEVRGGDHDRNLRAKTKHGQDAGRANSSAIRAAEDAAVRRFAAVGRGGGAPERTSVDADGSCKVTMSEAHSLVAKLE